jgi:small subunit ribosomal protein S18
VDYKDINALRRYMNDRGRIRARGATGTCAQHQRDVAVAIKTARELALLPYTVRNLAPGAGDRRGGPRREGPAPIAAETAVQTTDAPDKESSPQDSEPPEDPGPAADL